MGREDMRKKMASFCILEILEKYTDEDHRLTQKQIGNILRSEYGMIVNRKAIRQNLIDLQDFGYEIESDTPRVRTAVLTVYKKEIREEPVLDENGQQIDTRIRYETVLDENGNPVLEKQEYEEEVCTGWYINRKFTNAEIRYLIDHLTSTRYLPYSNCKNLIEKLETLATPSFEKTVLPQWHNDNKQFFNTVEVLEEAIRKGRQVSFSYCEYGTDKNLRYRRHKNGKPRTYIVNPYRTALNGGKYYLICNHVYAKTDSIYRIDRIKDIRLLDTEAKPFAHLENSGKQNMDFKQYMTEHVAMFSGPAIRTRFRIPKTMISDVIDLFGKDVTFSEETESHVTVQTKVNERAMVRFARTFLPDVTILAPQTLVNQIKADVQKASENYKDI